MVVLMTKNLPLFIFAALFLSALPFADFSMHPYLYSSEANGTVNYTEFSYNNSTAQIVNINGAPAMVLLDGSIATDKGTITDVITQYYNSVYYPSASDLAALHSDADSFNKSRNFMTPYGAAEKTCMQYTFLVIHPCNDLRTCIDTASMVCTISGAEGCLVDVLAQDILDYKNAINKLNDGNSRFESAFSAISPATISTELPAMSSALETMKQGAGTIDVSKLRFPQKTSCPDCLGVCPEANFAYASLTAAQSQITALEAKSAPYAQLEGTVDAVATSTLDRMNYKTGEEEALIFAPKLKSEEAKFASLKSQATEAKALVADSNFVSAADSFLNKGDTLDQDFAMRKFDSFSSELAAYDTAGFTLAAMINNSTAAYRIAADAQNHAGDAVLEAQWNVNTLSSSSVSAYNSLADRKNTLDASFKPPLKSSQYIALAGNYGKLQTDAGAFLASSNTVQKSIFGAGNALGRTSVDGAMALVSSMTPVSYQTRKSVATFVPPLVVGVIDLSLLAIGLLVFVGLFYYFRGGLFRSKIAASGWALIFLGFVFVLIVGSGAFYAMVISNEQYATFADFYGAYKASPSASVIVEETGLTPPIISTMHSCADQIEAQSKLLGKTVNKYYVNGNSCTSVTPQPNGPANSTNMTYTIKNGLKASDCLDKMPDVPIFDLYYSADNKIPVFTTVVTQSATFKYNEAAYGKSPMCPPADILG